MTTLQPRDLSTASLASIPKGAVVVIFTALHHLHHDPRYADTGAEMLARARQMDGFLDFVSLSVPEGAGISISYWRDHDSVARWRRDADHRAAQKAGQRDWYRAYRIDVAEVARSYTHGIEGV